MDEAATGEQRTGPLARIGTESVAGSGPASPTQASSGGAAPAAQNGAQPSGVSLIGQLDALLTLLENKLAALTDLVKSLNAIKAEPAATVASDMASEHELIFTGNQVSTIGAGRQRRSPPRVSSPIDNNNSCFDTVDIHKQTHQIERNETERRFTKADSSSHHTATTSLVLTLIRRLCGAFVKFVYFSTNEDSSSHRDTTSLRFYQMLRGTFRKIRCAEQCCNNLEKALSTRESSRFRVWADFTSCAE